MSKFEIHLSTDNAAFEGEDRNAEIARILHELADNIADMGMTDLARLRDINGNRVGYATFSEEDQ